MSKLLARGMGRSKETQTKEFDQAGSELGRTVFREQKEGFHPDRKPSENQGQRGHENGNNEELKFLG